MVDWVLKEAISIYFNRLALLNADMIKKNKQKMKSYEIIKEDLKKDYARHKEIVLQGITPDEIDSINNRLGFELIPQEDKK